LNSHGVEAFPGSDIEEIFPAEITVRGILVLSDNGLFCTVQQRPERIREQVLIRLLVDWFEREYGMTKGSASAGVNVVRDNQR
jgi:hypothetical protein